MIETLEPLTEQPGVELAMILTPDGVPITYVGRPSHHEHGDTGAGELDAGRVEAMAALAGAFLNELGQATAPMGCSPPERTMMRCARGTLVMRRIRGAVLLLLLDRGCSPEDVRLSMDGAAARIERGLRSSDGDTPEPLGAIPSGNANSRVERMAETESTPAGSEGLPTD